MVLCRWLQGALDLAAAPSIRARAKLFDPRTGIDVSQVKAGVVDGGVACTVDSFDAIVALIEECDHNSVELGLKNISKPRKALGRSSATLTFYVDLFLRLYPLADLGTSRLLSSYFLILIRRGISQVRMLSLE